MLSQVKRCWARWYAVRSGLNMLVLFSSGCHFRPSYIRMSGYDWLGQVRRGFPIYARLVQVM